MSFNLNETFYEDHLKQIQQNNFNRINFKNKFDIDLLCKEDFFTSYCDGLFENEKLNLKNELSKSYTGSLFKNKSYLNQNLLKMNNSLLMNESLDLQWFPDPFYQNALKSIFEYEINQPSDLDSLHLNENKCKSLCLENLNNFSKYNSHQSNNYESYSWDLDANLAQVDMENYNRNDINNVLNEINSKFSSSDEVQSANEQCLDNFFCSNLLDTDLYEKSDHKNNYFHLNEVFDKQALNSSFTLNSKEDKSSYEENVLANKTLTNLESMNISVDSLDMSFFEQECAEVVNKCQKQDKSKYTIAFEELNDSFMSLNSIPNLKQKDNENTKKIKNEKNNLIKFENSILELYNDEYDKKLNLNIESNIKKQNLNSCLYTKSLNNESHIYSNCLTQSEPESSSNFVPLFNLCASSTNSDSSSIKKNLNNYFIKNKLSLSASVNQLNVIQNDQTCVPSKKNSTDVCQQNKDEFNFNVISDINENKNKFTLSNTNLNYNQTNKNFSNEKNFKLLFNCQASPIHEEDESLINSFNLEKENKNYTNFQKINKNFKLDSSLQISQDKVEKEFIDKCPRSLSMNNFTNDYNNDYIKKHNLNQNIKLNKKTNFKECSISSGYFSGGSYNRLDCNRKKIPKNIKLNTLNTKCLMENNSFVSVQDKQIQTSILENEFEDKTFKKQQPTPIILNDLNKACNNCNNSSIHVYYPNYSLPDLNFVNNSSYNLVHLSPVKYQLPNFDIPNQVNQTSFLRSKRNNFKVRPKSCSDFENITKDSFNHIKDWESLNTLLPVEIRNLVQNLKLNVGKEQSKNVTKCKTTSNTPTSSKSFLPKYKTNLENCVVKLRPKLRKNNSLGSDENLIPTENENCCFNHCIHQNKKINPKRFSLQEPIHSEDNLKVCNQKNCLSTNGYLNNNKRGMIKSATMNMPIICQHNCSQIQSRPFYKTPFYSCLNFNNNQQCTCNSSGCCQVNCGIHHQNYPHCFRFNHFSKPFNPITELNEEIEYDSLNYLINNTTNGEIDFDQLINSEQNDSKNIENTSNENIINKFQKEVNKKEINKKESFNNLKIHWEKIAKTSSTSSGVTQTISNSKKVAKKDVLNSNFKKSPKTCNLIRNKTFTQKSSNRSPEENNKEICSSKKLVKTELSSKQITIVNNKNKVSNTENRNYKSNLDQQQQIIQPNKTPRPNSFNTQFKSMIPIAKNAIRSPPITK